MPAGYGFVRRRQLASTNAYAATCAKRGQRGPLWIWADKQTAGRGRRGRAWASLAGNVHVSLLLDPECPPVRIAQLGFVAGLACLDAAAAVLDGAGVHALALKWPNDLLADGAKVAGVLLETVTLETGAPSLVIGFGINVAAHPQDVAYPAAHLAAFKPGLDAVEVFAALTLAFPRRFAHWAHGAGFGRIREAWLQNAHGLNHMAEVNVGGERLSGRFAGLDAHGAMRLEQRDGGIKVILAGDYLGVPAS